MSKPFPKRTRSSSMCSGGCKSKGFDEAMSLAMLKMVADAVQASRDEFDAKARKRGYTGPSSYEASLSAAQKGIEEHLVKSQFLSPRPRRATLPLPSSSSETLLPSSPSRWRQMMKPLSPASKALLRPFKVLKKTTPPLVLVPEDSDEPSDTETIVPPPLPPKPKRATSLPCDLGAEASQSFPELTIPFPFHGLRNLKYGLEPSRRVRWASDEAQVEDCDTPAPPLVTFAPPKPASASWSETLDKTIAEITYSDIASTSPRLIYERATEELRVKKGIALAASLAAQRARNKSGGPSSSDFSLEAFIIVTCIGYSVVFLMDVACTISRVIDLVENRFSRRTVPIVSDPGSDSVQC